MIFVVDDEPINVQVLRNVLAPQGYQVRTADNGAEAIRAVQKEPPDLIILDVMMPGMTGLDVASKLRERHGLIDLPILMLTARSRTRDVIAGFESGANDYVVKPFIKDELLARVSTLIEARRGRGRAQENVRLRDEVERRVRVEDALRLSQRRMTGLLDSIAAGLVCINPGGTVTYANRAARTILGRPIELGTTEISALLPADARGDDQSRLPGRGRGHSGERALRQRRRIAADPRARAGGGSRRRLCGHPRCRLGVRRARASWPVSGARSTV